uniref:Uncharacterized protein n=1 Tax=Solanum tuberosum TaxID=4113 RepID=M1D2E2_SOLTU
MVKEIHCHEFSSKLSLARFAGLIKETNLLLLLSFSFLLKQMHATNVILTIYFYLLRFLKSTFLANFLTSNEP